MTFMKSGNQCDKISFTIFDSDNSFTGLCTVEFRDINNNIVFTFYFRLANLG
jgi:hypothetical protein